MGETFLITLREGVEISLIVAILLAYLGRIGRRDAFPAVWLGVAASAVLCLALALGFVEVIGGFEGRAEVITEAAVSLAAAGMLTFMIFWMRANARNLRGELHDRIGHAAEHSLLAVAVFAGIAVLREGIETALLLIGAESAAGTTTAQIVVGGLAGLGVATAIGWGFYNGSRRVDLRRFFDVTAVLLMLFAAGMVGKAAHELVELFELQGFLANPVWVVTDPALTTSWFARFASGMFGWSPEPELARVLAWVAYFVPVFTLYFGERIGAATRTRAAAKAEATDTAAA